MTSMLSGDPLSFCHYPFSS